ncbi:MAG: glycine cleavage system aminomethyltransferase GcvT [Parachlamydia sp.]|nr:glycine cleavage system aminomethyltransferase GcvT [Parachlamydia sp.]
MRTALYDKHIALGAKIVPFAGWEMPLHYPRGILHEHHAVRNAAGLFDVSHMGRIAIVGPDAEALLDYLSTNRIAGKPNLSTTYTVWANEQGGSVDDLIVYKQDEAHFFVIANASNREKDLAHLKRNSQCFNVSIQDCYHNEGILALQGPFAMQLAKTLIPEASSLTPHHFLMAQDLILSGTGYTGSGGCEIFAPTSRILSLWDQLLEAGAEPTGLGARDTLRLEMGYALYGHELSESIAPTESIATWTVKWDKDFLGKTSLEKLEQSSSKRHPYSIVLLEKGIAREGYSVWKEDQQIGSVTSGGFAPSLNKAIALILVQDTLSIGNKIRIQIRDTSAEAEVVHLPFH